MDLESKIGESVICIGTTRQTYRGRKMKPEVIPLIGKTLVLTPLWFMGDDDLYPGEWALGDADGYESLKSVGLVWIASGDVTPITLC